MRLTQSKELNKKHEVTGSNPVKYINKCFFIDFFFNSLVIFFSVTESVLNTTINIF